MSKHLTEEQFARLFMILSSIDKKTFTNGDFPPGTYRPRMKGQLSVRLQNHVFGHDSKTAVNARRFWQALRRIAQSGVISITEKKQAELEGNYTTALTRLRKFLTRNVPSARGFDRALNELRMAGDPLLGAVIADVSIVLGLRLKKGEISKGELTLYQEIAPALEVGRLDKLSLDERIRLRILKTHIARANDETFLLSRPKKYSASGYEFFGHGENCGMWSPRVSNALVDQHDSWKGGLAVEAYQDDTIATDYRDYGLLQAYRGLAEGKSVSNDRKFGLKTDILLVDGELPRTIKVRETDYVANLSTNDLSFCRASRKEDWGEDVDLIGSGIYDGLSLFVSEDGQMLDYQTSRCSNQLGTSVLAVTRDRRLLIVAQGERNLRSPGLLAPSGSGSLDADDLSSLANHGNRFVPWLEDVCQREMREELGLTECAVTIHAHLIGFGSMVHRGGLPQFYLIGYVDETYQELRHKRKWTAEESTLSAYARSAVADDANDSIFVLEDMNSHCLKRTCESALTNPKLSFPLAQIFEMLRHLSGATGLPDFIDSFLQRSTQHITDLPDGLTV